jgi:hypothetical protein
MNNLHSNLVYTKDEPINDEMTFLVMIIYFDKKYELKHHKKPQASKVLTNFKSENLKTNFINNDYPRSLVNEKIERIKNQNFTPKPRKKRLEN